MKNLMLALSLLTFSASVTAWELRCNVDEFTDEKKCRLAEVSDSAFFLVDKSEERNVYGFAIGDGQSVYDGSSAMMRIDSNEAIEAGRNSLDIVNRSIGSVLFVFRENDGLNILEQMDKGKSMIVRINPHISSEDIIEFDLDGFSSAWAEYQSYLASKL